jgi:nucleotide-binding universal stress UspA family protein
MLNGILLILGQTPAALAARKVAFDLALKSKTAITGLVVVDAEVVAPPEATPMGGASFKQRKDEVALERARTQAIESEETFARVCQEAGISCDATVVQGRTLKSVITACGLYDLVIAAVDASFEAAAPDTTSPLIERFLRDNPRPVIVCPRRSGHGKATLVAYDGSIAAMRALQLFCLLQLRKEGEVAVVAVRASEAEAADVCGKATEYLRKHGYTATSRAIGSADAPHAVLSEEAKRLNAGMIVAGAYGHQGWREWFLGTTTRRLFEASPAPVFVHH